MQFNTDENNPDWRSRIDKRFTSLRGYAALTVMLAHYQYIGFLPGVPVFKYSAQCGLMLFFFLSSFLLCHSLASDPNWTARPHLSLMTYSINRIFRIFPSLAVIIALTYWNRSSFFSSSIPYLEALRLSMTLGKAPSVLWTIPVELVFYVYLPIVLALTLPATRSRFCAAALASAYLAWCAAIAFARHKGVPASLWMTLGFHHYANSFVGGVLFYALLANDRIRFPQSAALVARIAPLIFVLAYPFLYFAIIRRDYSMAELAAPAAPGNPTMTSYFPSRPSSSAPLSTAFCIPRNLFVSRRANWTLHRIGEVSFGVYLVHIPMIVLFGSRYGYGAAQFCASIAATFAAAAALSAVIEKPGIAFGRGLGHWVLDRAKPAVQSPRRVVEGC